MSSKFVEEEGTFLKCEQFQLKGVLVALLPRGEQGDNFPDWAEATYGEHKSPRHTPAARVCLRSRVGITFHGLGCKYIPLSTEK